jgi:hypothetical protein
LRSNLDGRDFRGVERELWDALYIARDLSIECVTKIEVIVLITDQEPAKCRISNLGLNKVAHVSIPRVSLFPFFSPEQKAHHGIKQEQVLIWQLEEA